MDWRIYTPALAASFQDVKAPHAFQIPHPFPHLSRGINSFSAPPPFSNTSTIRAHSETHPLAIRSVAAAAAQYFTRSSEYFDAEGAGAVELLTTQELFSGPRLIGGLELSVFRPVCPSPPPPPCPPVTPLARAYLPIHPSRGRIPLGAGPPGCPRPEAAGKPGISN